MSIEVYMPIYIGRKVAKHIEEEQKGDSIGLFEQQRNDLPQISS